MTVFHWRTQKKQLWHLIVHYINCSPFLTFAHRSIFSDGTRRIYKKKRNKQTFSFLIQKLFQSFSGRDPFYIGNAKKKSNTFGNKFSAYLARRSLKSWRWLTFSHLLCHSTNINLCAWLKVWNEMYTCHNCFAGEGIWRTCAAYKFQAVFRNAHMNFSLLKSPLQESDTLLKSRGVVRAWEREGGVSLFEENLVVHPVCWGLKYIYMEYLWIV